MSETWEDTSHSANRTEGAISLPRRPLSRRALIKAAGIAPFIALAKDAWAEPTPSKLAALGVFTPISETELRWAQDEAATSFPNIDKEKFGLVARILWMHFHYGVGNVCPDPNLELLKLMYNDLITSTQTRTGDKIAENVNLGEFDPLGSDYQTNFCAYVCGHKAATKALAAKTPIDEAIYKGARAETQKEMKDKFDAACAMSGKQRSTKLGFGC